MFVVMQVSSRPILVRPEDWLEKFLAAIFPLVRENQVAPGAFLDGSYRPGDSQVRVLLDFGFLNPPLRKELVVVSLGGAYVLVCETGHQKPSHHRSPEEAGSFIRRQLIKEFLEEIPTPV